MCKDVNGKFKGKSKEAFKAGKEAVSAGSEIVADKAKDATEEGKRLASQAKVRGSEFATEARTAQEPGLGSLAAAVLLPVMLGFAVSAYASPNTDWYRGLSKPWWQPPDAFFGIAWSVLYALMGAASWYVWREGGLALQEGPLKTYGVQLVLNLLWPISFFKLKSLLVALVNIVALDIAVIATILAFKPVNEFAAKLMYPYLVWVLFATVLNYRLWRSNPDGPATAPGTTASKGPSYKT